MKLHIVLELVLLNLHSSSLPALPHTLHLCPEYSESEVFGKENQIFIIKVPHTLHFCPEYSMSEVFDKKNLYIHYQSSSFHSTMYIRKKS